MIIFMVVETMMIQGEAVETVDHFVILNHYVFDLLVSGVAAWLICVMVDLPFKRLILLVLKWRIEVVYVNSK